jgi:hypothetical protein
MTFTSSDEAFTSTRPEALGPRTTPTTTNTIGAVIHQRSKRPATNAYAANAADRIAIPVISGTSGADGMPAGCPGCSGCAFSRFRINARPRHG